MNLENMESKNVSTHHMSKRTKCIEALEEKKLIGKDGVMHTKRSAENSPEVGAKKRSILGNITNRGVKISILKPNETNKKHSKAIKISNNVSSNVTENESVTKTSSSSPTIEIKEEIDDSPLYVTAIEDSRDISCDTEINTSNVTIKEDLDVSVNLLPPEVEDFDKQSKNDPFSESLYAPFIFKYYREREEKFVVNKYMHTQHEITKGMRAVLVDWMVEVQESFELNHETLYLAVKLVDLYLVKHVIKKATLQLVGATAILLASKYDERVPPLVDDFLYICDDSYTRDELIRMEIDLLKTINFDLGIPISYRFLRRYARCSQASMETLTLARYILETALMDYELIDAVDSKSAAAALLLALKMKSVGSWTPTLQYYTGYQESELNVLLQSLNKNISAPPNTNLQTIRAKYSHQIFFEVAKVSPLNLENV